MNAPRINFAIGVVVWISQFWKIVTADEISLFSDTAAVVSREGVCLSVSLPIHEESAAGIPLKVTVNNDTFGILFVGGSEIWSRPNCTLTVTGPDGKQCVKTQKGEETFGADTLAGQLFSLEINNLGPAQSRTWTVNLKDLFVITPGKYTIKVEFSVGGNKIKKPFVLILLCYGFFLRH